MAPREPPRDGTVTRSNSAPGAGLAAFAAAQTSCYVARTHPAESAPLLEHWRSTRFMLPNPNIPQNCSMTISLMTISLMAVSLRVVNLGVVNLMVVAKRILLRWAMLCRMNWRRLKLLSDKSRFEKLNRRQLY